MWKNRKVIKEMKVIRKKFTNIYIFSHLLSLKNMKVSTQKKMEG